ncbi:uncharacterized protein PAE49_004330 isoform 2-T3 [Odontesthes bonariensis]|uniref:uncharacterized protein mtus1b isoform X2 n=1 Tax=Odontesthes bonariensis TaxID=219752 RepID=UPI003F58066A
MSVCEPSEGFRGQGGSGMKLPLHRAGDHNGNAFPISSSSSSSSSSCLGESSPESLRSLSSLSGGRTGSPLDYDMLEVTLMTTVVTTTDEMADVVLSKWVPDEVIQPPDDDEVSERKRLTAAELSESNDTSVSVYLDANSGPDAWNDTLTLASSADGGLSSGSSSGRRHGSCTPDSDTTEIPADDDDEEEGVFVSVSSDTCVRSSRLTLTRVESAAETQLHPEATVALSGANELESERPPDPPPASGDLCGSSQTSVSEPFPPPEEADECPEVSKVIQTNPAAKTKATPPHSAVKSSSLEAKRVSRPDLKSVKAKVGSWSNMSPSKTAIQKKAALVGGKRAAPRKEKADGSKRPSAGPVKVAVLLKPARGKSSNLKNNHKMAATTNPAQPENKSVSASRTRSASTSSLGSEVVGEGPLKAAPEEPDVVDATRSGEASVEEQKESTGEAVLVEDAVEKPRSPGRRVSSKLGPAARHQGRGTRADKGPSGPAPPPGSGTGPPGQGEGGQSGSPPRGKPSQGIPKPRTNADRSSAFAAQSPTAAVSRPAANQQSAAGSAGRPAAPAASKLPVKGLNASLSSSSLGTNENNVATSKGAPAPTGTKPDDRPSRGTLPSGSQSAAKPPGSGTAAPSDAATKPPAMRSRAPSLQARTSATGLKTPTVTNTTKTAAAAAGQTLAKVAAAGQGSTKQTTPLQRSGSARLGRVNGAVDKNKPREAPTRPANTSSSSQSPAGNQQNQQLPPAELVLDVVNANTVVTPALPAPAADATSTASGTTGPAGLGFKARTGSRSSPKTGPRLQNASKPGVVAEGTVTAKQNQNKEQVEKKNQAICQLRRLLVQGNKRVEALATVIQHVFTEREDALKQKRELSLDLSKLRDELVVSSQCCERLQREKEEARVSLEEAVKRLEEQHREELVQLEDRLRSFYQTEWDKVHQVYQEEADKCRVLMEQQVEELRRRQEAERKNQEAGHSQRMESLKQQYESSIEELRRIQHAELEDLQKTLKETETSLSEKISELSAEKEDLSEKLRAEEERRRRILSDKNLKDSHTVYLEQELESLKVVLEIKNNQLHQKEKKLMEMDKLVETNVKLEECLTKVQQENEDYRARMDKHAALSKQLSSEQAVLQQTLQKESKVNKRLSMENEELLWKLHNGDLLASPRRLSPTSPFSSPRNSASFPTAAPLSPR